MRLRDVVRILEAQVLTGEDRLDEEVEAACGCDLISDILAFTKARMLVLTGLVSPQMVRAAEMMDLAGIVFVRGKKPPSDIVGMAREAGLPVLCTSYPLYDSSGLLFEAGLPGRCARPPRHGGPQDAP
ncbi:MAG: DRTGG domain-containing protein [Bacillota bacterium]